MLAVTAMRVQRATRVKIFSLMLALAATMSNACRSAPSSFKNAEKGWSLTQAHCTEKLMLVRITEHGVRLDTLRGSWTIMAVGPSWEATLYSRGGRTILHVPYKNWSTTGFRRDLEEMATVPQQHSVRQSRASISPYGTLPVTQTEWKGTSASYEDMMFRTAVRPRACSFLLQTTPKITVAPQVRLFLSHFYHVPLTSELPLEYSNSVDSRPRLHTLELRQIDVPGDLYTPPVGYRAVKSESDFWIDAGDKAKINDLGELMGAPGK
jgi:hypothetical protein